MRQQFLIHEAGDMVGVAGRFQTDDQEFQLEVVDPVPLGHKVALRDIPVGEEVIEYGIPIGLAT